jgi:hypothetical protein
VASESFYGLLREVYGAKRFLAPPIGHRGYLAAPTSGKCQGPFETAQPHVQ